MLAKILAERHGFRTTVLFAINPETGFIDPNYHQNIPGLQFLAKADLMIIATRFRELPDDQMQHIHNYFVAGKPVIGLRTATHAFHYSRNPNNKYAKYGFKSTQKGWEGGFGKRILGENWVNHHGASGKEGTRGLINGLEAAADNPILKGIMTSGQQLRYTVLKVFPQILRFCFGDREQRVCFLQDRVSGKDPLCRLPGPELI
jgi:hypothetical protein